MKCVVSGQGNGKDSLNTVFIDTSSRGNAHNTHSSHNFETKKVLRDKKEAEREGETRRKRGDGGKERDLGMGTSS